MQFTAIKQTNEPTSVPTKSSSINPSDATNSPSYEPSSDSTNGPTQSHWTLVQEDARFSAMFLWTNYTFTPPYSGNAQYIYDRHSSVFCSWTGWLAVSTKHCEMFLRSILTIAARNIQLEFQINKKVNNDCENCKNTHF